MKKTSFMLLIVAVLLLAMSVTAYAISTSQYTIVVTGIVGKSSSSSSADTVMDYISCSTHLMNNGVVKATNLKQYWVAMTAGPVSAYWTGIGTKTGKGYHTYAKSSAGFSKAVWTYDS